jgi:hypothetical protein
MFTSYGQGVANGKVDKDLGALKTTASGDADLRREGLVNVDGKHTQATRGTYD